MTALLCACAAPSHDGHDGWGQQTELVPIVDWDGRDASADLEAGPVVVEYGKPIVGADGKSKP